MGNEFRDGEPEGAAVPTFRVLVEGVPRTINPIVRDELYRIGREAIGNAFRHARATEIEVELIYNAHALALRVRDDGVGIESRLLANGRRDGHWGLPGMRERTRGLGGRFTLWSELRQPIQKAMRKELPRPEMRAGTGIQETRTNCTE